MVALGLLTGHMLGMFVFALLLRMVLTHHFTFLINSAAHMWGSQPYSTGNSARDNWLLSFFSFGEGYHNYHHSFQADYRNGPRLYNWDPSKWLIWTMARLGLASGLRRSPLDVTMGRIFEHGRNLFRERLAAIGETVDDWQESTRTRTAATREALRELIATSTPDALRDHVVAAERRCEEALAEFKAARIHFQAVVGEGAGIIARRHLRRQVREARRSVHRALNRWHFLGRAYLDAMLSQPLPSSA